MHAAVSLLPGCSVCLGPSVNSRPFDAKESGPSSKFGNSPSLCRRNIPGPPIPIVAIRIINCPRGFIPRTDSGRTSSTDQEPWPAFSRATSLSLHRSPRSLRPSFVVTVFFPTLSWRHLLHPAVSLQVVTSQPSQLRFGFCNIFRTASLTED